jgi:hypothetical protein
MNTIVPLISSGVAGPLGVLHLPRLWLKVSLEARGKLATGYPGIGKGYDMMVISALGLEPQKVADYVKNQRPDLSAVRDLDQATARRETRQRHHR